MTDRPSSDRASSDRPISEPPPAEPPLGEPPRTEPPLAESTSSDARPMGRRATGFGEALLDTDRLSHNWWAIALRGVVAIAFGLLALFLPGLTLLSLVFLFAAYAIVDGAFSIVSGARRRPGRGRDWLLVLGGILGIVAGVIAFLWPGITTLVLLLIIAAWAIVTGVAEIVAAFRLRKEIEGEWLLVLDGAVSVVFGLFLALFPGAGALALVWLIAFFAIASGVMLLVLAFRLRSRDRAASGVRPQARAAS
jgi:uncharacterized membrane protein HdeD (DUF308 family)